MMMVFSQVLQSYRKEGRSKALFIIRYEGHVDLVTAHKPHFEIVETRGLATVLASKLTLGLFLLKNSDWDFE